MIIEEKRGSNIWIDYDWEIFGIGERYELLEFGGIIILWIVNKNSFIYFREVLKYKIWSF